MTAPVEPSPHPYRSWGRDRWMFDNEGAAAWRS